MAAQYLADKNYKIFGICRDKGINKLKKGNTVV